MSTAALLQQPCKLVIKRKLQVDAFTAVPFAGNPAAVVLIDQKSAAVLDDETRQRIAAEMNLSETSFVELKPANPEASSFRKCR